VYADPTVLVGLTTGQRLNGPRLRSRRFIVSVMNSTSCCKLTRHTDVATKLGLRAPIAEQCQHNHVVLHLARRFRRHLVQHAPPRAPREGVPVRWYYGVCECQLTIRISPLCKKYELGTGVFSALASGLVTGKVWL
jgi:hypothetical protein